MSDRRPTGRPGLAYTDPTYDTLEAKLEQEYGLPSGGMRAIRTKGERSNADQVSEAGAKSVYQIIPGTRDAFFKTYGVDAYASPENAARVAALHLRDSMKRNGGDWAAAVGEYHGGTSRANWGAKTKAYTSRVTGRPIIIPADQYGATMLSPDASPEDINELYNLAPDQIGSGQPVVRPTAPKGVSKAEALVAAVGGVAEPVRASGAADMSVAIAEQKAAYHEQATNDAITFTDRLSAAVDKNWLLNQIARGIDKDVDEGDPNWHKKFLENRETFTAFAQNADELEQMYSDRAMHSFEGMMAVQNDIANKRKNDKVINSNGTGWAFELGTTIADPAGWLMTAGVGKAMQVAGKAGGLMRSVTEGGVVSLGYTAALDYSGQHQTASDYLLSGVSGMAMGAALHPIIGAKGTDRSATDMIQVAHVEAQEQAEALMAKARENLTKGDPTLEPSPDALQFEVKRLHNEDIKARLDISLSDVGEENKFLSSDEALIKEADQAKVIVDANGLSHVDDSGTQKILTEIIGRSDNMSPKPIPVVGKFLQWTGRYGIGESTGTTLTRSNSSVLRSVGMQLLEGTTGAAGRRRTAAIAQVQRERLYLRDMVEHTQLFTEFRRAKGVGPVRAAMDADVMDEFNRRIFLEVEARANMKPGLSKDTDAAVRRAADNWERGMERMRVEQQHIKTLGFERLGDSSRGYMRHMLDPKKINALTSDERTGVEQVLASQFQELNKFSYIDKKTKEVVERNFDKKFSNKLAKAYLHEALRRGNGTFSAPAHIASSEGADIIADALKAMKGLSDDEQKAVLSKFSRGGASYTKGRLKLNLLAPIGKSGKVLGDVFDHDINRLYNGYARRVSGEVALAQHGVYGKKGLDLLREAAEMQGASKAELDAFDQIASEFLNIPYGKGSIHGNLDNLRIMTSTARLGGMGFMQLGEYGNGIAAVGYSGVFNAMGSMRRLRKEVTMFAKGQTPKNELLQSFDDVIGPLGTDGYQTSRLFNIAPEDIHLNNDEAMGRFGKTIRGASHAVAVASFHRVIAAVQTRGMAEEIVKKAVRYAKLGTDDIALRDMGITPEIQSMLRDNMDKIATFDSKGRLTSLNLRAEEANLDPSLVKTMGDAIERGAGQIIQRTYIGETGKWAHSSLTKFLTQFRTFGITSVEKQWGRNFANYGGVKSFGIILGAMSFAAPIHFARTQLRMVGMSRQEREEYAENNLNALAMGRQILNYASSTGLLSDGLDITSIFGANIGLIPDNYAKQLNGGGRGRETSSGIVPGLGMADDILKGTVGGQFEKLPKLLPGANLPYATPLVNALTPDKEE